MGYPVRQETNVRAEEVASLPPMLTAVTADHVQRDSGAPAVTNVLLAVTPIAETESPVRPVPNVHPKARASPNPRTSRRAPAFIGKVMPLIAALSPKRVGMRSRSPGTTGRWPEFATGICAKLSERQQSHILCKGSHRHDRLRRHRPIRPLRLLHPHRDHSGRHGNTKCASVGNESCGLDRPNSPMS